MQQIKLSSDIGWQFMFKIFRLKENQNHGRRPLKKETDAALKINTETNSNAKRSPGKVKE